MVCRHVNYLIKICLVIKMTLTRNQRKFSWTNRMSAFASCRFQNVNIFMNCLISPQRMIKIWTVLKREVIATMLLCPVKKISSKFRRDQIDMFV